MKTMQIGYIFFLALLVTGGVATAQNSGDTAQEQHLDGALLLLKEGKPGEAITNELNLVIAYYEKLYSSESRRIYCARTPAEESAYLAESGSKKQEALVLGPQYSKAHYLKGYALLELEQPAAARSSLDKALELSPLNANYLNESAHLYQAEKNWEESLKQFMRAADCARAYSPDEDQTSELSRALRGQGYCLIELGQLAEAEAIYLECLRVDPDDKIAMDELAYTQDQKIFQAAHLVIR